jgi:hypothetical protein
MQQMTPTQLEVHLEVALKFINSATNNPMNGFGTKGFDTYIEYLKQQVQDEYQRKRFSILVDGALALKALQLNILLNN